MKRSLLNIFVILVALLAGYVSYSFAAQLVIPWSDTIKGASIIVDANGNTIEQVGQSFWLKILGLMKIVISGFALIFMVMIGVNMVIMSDSEERVKTQRRQIVYVLIGFLFLNIPGVIYDVMMPGDASSQSIVSGSWSSASISWYTAGLDGFIGSLFGFFRVFAYGVAILMLSWGFFRLILSSGEEEQVKAAKSRVINSILGLVFLLFVEGWIRAVSGTNFVASISGVAGQAFRLAIFFAAPVAIFFIIYGAYYYITSAGDEERIKKWKNILMNTLIASIILIAAFSFLSDLASFNF